MNVNMLTTGKIIEGSLTSTNTMEKLNAGSGMLEMKLRHMLMDVNLNIDANTAMVGKRRSIII